MPNDQSGIIDDIYGYNINSISVANQRGNANNLLGMFAPNNDVELIVILPLVLYQHYF